MANVGFDLTHAAGYHYGRFPPPALDYERLVPSLTAATASIARYDALLRTLHSSEVLLAPLRRREAVISSRIEGTVATLDEVLKFEAEEYEDNEDSSYRREVLEVFSYSRAMNHAQNLMTQGLPLSGRLLREAHSRLLFFGRGADKQPGTFKTEQNYVVDQERKKVLFIPVDVERFNQHLRVFEEYINSDHDVPLIQTALAHAEFESIHPFKDGNGRLGRMLVTLMLWNKGVIAAPHFYMSGCIERMKDEYINRLRAVSSNDEWTEWCEFFFRVIEQQAEENSRIADNIRHLYEDMKSEFRKFTASQWSINALDFVFSRPIFRNSAFTSQSGIPKQTAHRISNALSANGLLSLVEPASGRRSALYAFEPLLGITRA
jgi:Fic family protein